jgi:hypothetical protein
MWGYLFKINSARASSDCRFEVTKGSPPSERMAPLVVSPMLTIRKPGKAVPVRWFKLLTAEGLLRAITL